MITYSKQCTNKKSKPTNLFPADLQTRLCEMWSVVGLYETNLKGTHFSEKERERAPNDSILTDVISATCHSSNSQSQRSTGERTANSCISRASDIYNTMQRRCTVRYNKVQMYVSKIGYFGSLHDAPVHSAV